MSKFIWLLSGFVLALAAFFALKQPHAPQVISNKNMTTTSVAKRDLEFEKWNEFSAPEGQFKVLFPSLPQHATEKQGNTESEMRLYDMYVAEQDNGTIFMISMITNLDNKNTKIDSSVLSRVLNEMMATNPDSTVKKMEMGKYKDNPSMDFALEHKDVHIDGKAFTDGKTLFVLTSVAKMENYQPAEFNFFVNSFELLGK